MVVYYVSVISAPLEELRVQAQDLSQARAGITRTATLLATQSSLRAPVAPVPLPRGALGVAFERVTFAYDSILAEASNPAVQAGRADLAGSPAAVVPAIAPGTSLSISGFALRDVSFALAPGRVLGVLGRTGGGKTTLTRLLFRLYDVDGGCVRVGGVDVRAAWLAELRARVGIITQEVQLFRASVRDNLAFFDPAVPNARIEGALRALGLWQWVQALPAGLDTIIGSEGSTTGERKQHSAGLSAGEAQLLAFARVFLKDAGLVVLDEASSRLDPATERLLEGAVDRLLDGRTGVIVAHRLSTVARADDILIMEAGAVAEYGPRVELAADPASRFSALVRAGMAEVLA
jgi:ABC-type multidrug transport system fused ATPase/permease subunit